MARVEQSGRKKQKKKPSFSKKLGFWLSANLRLQVLVQLRRILGVDLGSSRLGVAAARSGASGCVFGLFANLQLKLTPGSLTLAAFQALHEALDLACRVHDALLARVEGVAVAADIRADLRLGAASEPTRSARADDPCIGIVLRMDIGSHLN
jgi:hypothetical protein